MVESRIPGRTGDYGWTVREGIAKDIHGTRSHVARGEPPGESKKGASQESREGID
jgi:hypothetical protein